MLGVRLGSRVSVSEGLSVGTLVGFDAVGRADCGAKIGSNVARVGDFEGLAKYDGAADGSSVTVGRRVVPDIVEKSVSSLEGDSSFTKSIDPVSFDGIALGCAEGCDVSLVRICGGIGPTDVRVDSLCGSRVLAITPTIAPASSSNSSSR